MFGMTYRVYLRWPDQQTSDKTTTEDEVVAQTAFTRLTQREDLRGQKVGVAFSKDREQVAFHNFLTGVTTNHAGAQP